LALEKTIQQANVCLTQLEMPIDVVAEFADLAFRNGKTFILNPAPATTLPLDLLAKVTFLTPNEHELGLITGLPMKSVEDIATAGKKLLSCGVKNVIVTLGSKGCLWLDKTKQILIPSMKVTPIDTTGAGDAFNGALAYCLDKGMDVLSSCQYATKAGALATLKKGALVSLPTCEEMAKV
jgi:Sugar kinases, ribokinase family